MKGSATNPEVLPDNERFKCWQDIHNFFLDNPRSYSIRIYEHGKWDFSVSRRHVANKTVEELDAKLTALCNFQLQ